MSNEKEGLDKWMQRAFSKVFVGIFSLLAVAMVISLIIDVSTSFIAGEDGMQIFLSSINTGIIALAIFELAMIINTEYVDSHEGDGSEISGIQRALPKFIGMVCVALSLEGLIMVIKYSQLELAGNLYYPVAIISSTALLLAALGLFTFLTSKSN